MKTMREAFGLPVGYSDHTLGITACVAAAALGAAVLEKHFTTDRQAKGPDHILSADPPQMKELVAQVRLVETMRGGGLKMPAASEKTTRVNNRKSVVMTRDLPAGHKLTEADMAIKRPGYGIAPKHLELLAGRTLNRPLEADEVLSWSDLQ
jgi:N-acetylneuraminate synthase